MISGTTCPVCNQPCTDSYRLSVHIKGAHGNWHDYEEKIRNEMKESFDKYMVVSEPDVTVADEVVIASANEDTGSKELSIDSYLRPHRPICREERQYAHLLAQALANGDQKIKRKFSKYIKESIKSVFFEATFMRDFWANDPIGFNQQLLEYLAEKGRVPNSDMDTWIGGDHGRHPNHWKVKCMWARVMINAKPDIAIFTQQGVLHFIECKYLSPEDTYTVENNEKITQTTAQKEILYFLKKLCNITVGKVIKVEFTSEIHKKTSFAQVEICFADIVPQN